MVRYFFQCTSDNIWHCGGGRTQAFPSGEGGSRVSRKRETDEGHLPLPLGEVPEAERVQLPSQSLRDSSPKVGAEKRVPFRISQNKYST